jgi:hypothetical protein
MNFAGGSSLKIILRSRYKDKQIVDLVNPGEKKSPLPRFNKGVLT